MIRAGGAAGRRAAAATGALVGLALLVAACSGGPARVGAPRPVENPSGPGSMAPNLTLGLDGRIYLSWIEPAAAGHELRFSRWEEQGWSAPRTIAAGEEWFVNWADFPAMAALEDGTLAAHWLAKSGEETYAYDVWVALSRDGGRSWSEPLRPHRDGTRSEHGFVSLLPTAEGRFELLWLDGRNTVRSPREPMTLRFGVLLPDGTLESEAEIDAAVCDCCSTDAVRTAAGATVVAYRDRSPTEIRDISVARRAGGSWSRPATVHADGWEIAGCPVNGPALAGDGDRVAVAWFTAAGGESAVRVAVSNDGGRRFEPPLRVDSGAPLGRVDLVLDRDGVPVVSWLERTGDEARIVLRRVAPSATDGPTTVAVTRPTRAGGFPRMVRSGSSLHVAWTDPAEPTRIRTAVLEL